MGEIKITFIANAGLLFDFGGTKLLVDGLYDSPPEGFSRIPESTLSKLMSAVPPFDGINALLFTHTHPDHFSSRLIGEYMRANPIEKLAVPPLGQDALSFSFSNGLTVCAVLTRHLDKRFSTVPHVCYLFSYCGKNILVTGDVDYTAEAFEEFAGLRLQAVFVTPLFFSALCRGRFFKGRLNAERLCVYHLPFASDDRAGILPRLEREMKLWKEKGESAVSFTETLQALIL